MASATLLILWAIFVGATGGLAFDVAGVHLSSTRATNPLIVAALLMSAAAGLSVGCRHGGLGSDVRWLWSRLTTAAMYVRCARTFDVAALAAIAGTVLVLSTWWLDRPFWLDEQMIALNVRERSLLELLGPLTFEQRAPFGWLAVARTSGALFGFSDLALRLVPVSFAVAMLVTAWFVGRRWMGATGATALVALCGLSSWTFYHSLEFKHYSADLLFGLLLPALAVWSTEAGSPEGRLKRAATWWAAAAVGQWFANGALFVTPACAVALSIWFWRFDGLRRALTFATYGLGWLACFACYYALTLRFTIGSEYMRQFWATALPPPDAGVVATMAWLGERAAPFAAKPGGTELTTLFWVVALCGLTFARRSLLGLTLATVPLSMFLFAGLGWVPLYERLSIWALPALYVALALCIDTGVRWIRHGLPARHTLRTAGGAVLAAMSLTLSVDVLQRGWQEFLAAYPRDSNHQLDDRSGVTWIAARSRPGDAILTTRLALPALWWYGGRSVAPSTTGGLLTNGAPVLVLSYQPPTSECDADALRRTLAPFDRALVYLGFRFDDVPDGFDELLLDNLARLGRVTEPHAFPGVTRAAIVDLSPAASAATDDGRSARTPRLAGCLAVQEAVLW